MAPVVSKYVPMNMDVHNFLLFFLCIICSTPYIRLIILVVFMNVLASLHI